MKKCLLLNLIFALAPALPLQAGNVEGVTPQALPAPLTPPAPSTPRINGPAVFGVRPQSPVLYNIPATGDRPMSFAADGLPPTLSIDANTGFITGVSEGKGDLPHHPARHQQAGCGREEVPDYRGRPDRPDPGHGVEQLELLCGNGHARQDPPQWRKPWSPAG